MQLQRAVIMFNSFDFENDGVPPRTFGGQITFSGGGNSLQLQMKPETVSAILDLIAEEIAEGVQSMAKTITPTVVRSGGLALDYKPQKPEVPF